MSFSDLAAFVVLLLNWGAIWLLWEVLTTERRVYRERISSLESYGTNLRLRIDDLKGKIDMIDKDVRTLKNEATTPRKGQHFELQGRYEEEVSV